MSKKRTNLLVIYAFLVSIILLSFVFTSKLFSMISFGTDTTSITISNELEKYINYNLSEEDKGTLVQYGIKTKIEYGEEVLPVNASEMTVNLGKIEEKYPYEVKVISENNFENTTQYDSNTGILSIYTNEQRENVDNNYNVICYYDTYTDENLERDLSLEVNAKAVFSDAWEKSINKEEQFNYHVTEKLGELTSIDYTTDEVYNGYIKSNIINGTDYNTQYQEKLEVEISNKSCQENLEISENNTFVKEYKDANEEIHTQDVGNNNHLVYKSTRISKKNVQKLLGEEGTIDIIDPLGENGKEAIIATINKDTQFDEDGTITIIYENEPQNIILKTSKIQSEGILLIDNIKEIKNNIENIDNIKIKTTTDIIGIKKETIQESQEAEEQTIEKQVYKYNNEKIVDILDSQTNVDIEMNNTNWTNQKQNDITFDISLNANTAKDNMFKNPTIKIELPSQVEKVIIQSSGIFNANGLELEDPYIENNENGIIAIVANLKGQQTEYSENKLELTTDIKISASIILKKDIKDAETTAKLIYTNQYTVDKSIETKMKEIPLYIDSYQQEAVRKIEKIDNHYDTAIISSDNLNELKLEVAPVRGSTTIKNGDIVYEGEFIKYNIKVTNISDVPIENVKIIGNIPDGTRYGELIADYYKETKDSFYQFDDNSTSKEIEIGTIEAGQTISEFYEVQVKDLEEGEEEKSINSTIKAYIGEKEVTNYEMTNIIQPSKAKILLTAFLGLQKDMWTYHIDISSENEEQATVKLNLPKEFKVSGLSRDNKNIDMEGVASISEDNIMTINVDTDVAYYVEGFIDRSKLTQETEESKEWLMATANIILADGATYQSNENRILYEYQTASISMKSNSEGEEVAYDEEIDYTITITNTGRTNLGIPFYSNSITVNITDFLPEDIKPVSVTYDNWEEERTINEENRRIYKNRRIP